MFKRIKKGWKKIKKWKRARKAYNVLQGVTENMHLMYNVQNNPDSDKILIYVTVKMFEKTINVKRIEVPKNGKIV